MGAIEKEQFQAIVQFIEEIDFGSLHITIHNGQITQIERTEKKRFENVKKQKVK
ncbi:MULTISPECIES: YezD family protein [Shouchella]|jgi:hypothetical protein|uniref:DUF2292 domain-containing protein n=1 Tax=Shouchella clausii (strain KSM-K16) TaxID=66692 RepID=Q5WKG9_SHOC1|nr:MULTISPECIES: YezD family protein [Shouchella]MCM3379606.1 YezD family protein [Shouchella rhizosphaerae]MDO7269082.1 YezD family protein [Shouchella clausii]MDO7288701.1 YezD family protein [Shouchella clausii]PAD16387.1 DUF2292 domain-containing protein [Shouchella clausii]PAE81856.1 DUF2292 domain-containing protein [Shouchella clausii]